MRQKIRWVSASVWEMKLKDIPRLTEILKWRINDNLYEEGNLNALQYVNNACVLHSRYDGHPISQANTRACRLGTLS